MLESIQVIRHHERFLTERTSEDEASISSLFEEIAQQIYHLGAQKAQLPAGFVRDVRLYVEGKREVVDYFDDIERRYLLLADLYGYLKLRRAFEY